MSQVKNICAVFDMQGFYADNTFYPREFAVVNNEFKICFEIDCYIPRDVKIKNFKHFSFQQNNIHGIPLSKVISENTSRVLKLENLKTIIYEIYSRIRTDDKIYVAIKNQQLSKLLE